MRRLTEAQPFARENIPYAQFRFNGEVIKLNELQFKQAVADGRLCKCNTCLACRAAQYMRDIRETN